MPLRFPLSRAVLLVLLVWAALNAAPPPGVVAAHATQYIFPDEEPMTTLSSWRIREGDSVQWAAAALDDGHWEPHRGAGLWALEGRPRTGVVWLRTTIFIPSVLDSLQQLALYQRAFVSASELYWDGQLVGRNGLIDSVAEQCGQSAHIILLPPHLCTPGEHRIAVRLANFSTFSGLIDKPLQIGYVASMLSHFARNGAMMIGLAAIFLCTGLFHIAVLFGYRDKWPFALFSLFCIANAVHSTLRSLMNYFHVDLGQYYLLATVNDLPWFLIMTMLPTFFLYEFSFPRKGGVAAWIGGVALGVIGLSRLASFELLPIRWLPALIELNRLHSLLTMLGSAGVAGWALYKRKVGCLTAAAGLLFFLLGVVLTDRLELDYGWALGFCVMIIFLTASLSNQMAQRTRLAQEGALRAARLELELLKKHIQPHFLLNSLNSIVAWLAEEPRMAVRLLTALADELRLMLGFVKLSRVPLSQELRLCEHHLEVMSLRYDKRFRLECQGVDGALEVPPLLMHTLIENGLTHGYAGREEGLFRLVQEHYRGGQRLILFNDSSLLPQAVAQREGTGLAYVRSRLQEMFGSGWRLSSGPVDNGWQVVIDMDTL